MVKKLKNMTQREQINYIVNKLLNSMDIGDLYLIAKAKIKKDIENNPSLFREHLNYYMDIE